MTIPTASLAYGQDEKVEKDCNCKDNIIVEEVKKGYLIKDTIFRPSQVIVVKNKEDKNGVE